MEKIKKTELSWLNGVERGFTCVTGTGLGSR